MVRDPLSVLVQVRVHLPALGAEPVVIRTLHVGQDQSDEWPEALPVVLLHGYMCGAAVRAGTGCFEECSECLVRFEDCFRAFTTFGRAV